MDNIYKNATPSELEYKTQNSEIFFAHRRIVTLIAFIKMKFN
jgi:hypothetical protein